MSTGELHDIVELHNALAFTRLSSLTSSICHHDDDIVIICNILQPLLLLSFFHEPDWN